MQTFHIYSDESRQKSERFLLVGGLWIKEKNVLVLKKKIKQLRQEYSYTNDDGRKIIFAGEFKWTKVSTKYYTIYQKLVDIFFDGIDKDIHRFCCLLLDTHLPEVVNYANLNKDGYFKLLYQLYFHNSKTPGYYKIYPDRISNPTKNVNLSELQSSLNHALGNKFFKLINPELWSGHGSFVKCIQPLDSKKEDLIQVVDVIIGSIGYFQNRHFNKENAKKAKVDLMKYVLNKLILNGAIHFTGKKFITARSTKLNIWLFKPRNKQKEEGWTES